MAPPVEECVLARLPAGRGQLGGVELLASLPPRAVHRTLLGPSIGSYYNILSLIEPLLLEILCTALKQFHETYVVQKRNSLGGPSHVQALPSGVSEIKVESQGLD